jgi:hypothetical protein
MLTEGLKTPAEEFSLISIRKPERANEFGWGLEPWFV